MLRFKQFVEQQEKEEKSMPAKKNLHLEHLEDEIINYGVDGGRDALNFLRS